MIHKGYSVFAEAYFNPRSSCEERLSSYFIKKLAPSIFQSTLLMRGATPFIKLPLRDRPISIHAPHARSDVTIVDDLGDGNDISIHAPHARSDSRTACTRRCNGISIHAPHARSDAVVLRKVGNTIKFQSTLLMRGATLRPLRYCSGC